MTDVYYIFFCSSDQWFAKFLHTDFSHVFVYKKLKGETYIQMQPSWHLEANLVSNIKDSFADVKNIYNMKIIKIEANHEIMKHNFFFFLSTRWGIYNCVLLTKYMLGLRSWCFTPYGLFECLTRGLYKKKNKHLFNIEVV